jgi:hypothetical protein
MGTVAEAWSLAISSSRNAVAASHGYKDVAPDVFSVEKPVSSYAAEVEPRLLGSFAQRRR